MKKLFALILLLCMCVSCAQAAGVLERTETRVVREAGEDDAEIFVYLQLKNTGNAPVGLDNIQVQFVDAEMNVVLEEGTFSMYPPTLQPGQIGYACVWAYNVELDVAQAITNYAVTVKASHDYLIDVSLVDNTVEHKKVENPYYTEHQAFLTITNATAETIWQPEIVLVVRNQDGKILTIENDALYDVGIPAGGHVYYGYDFSSFQVERWQEKGQEIATMETIVYLENDTW